MVSLSTPMILPSLELKPYTFRHCATYALYIWLKPTIPPIAVTEPLLVITSPAFRQYLISDI